ncbi:sensor histidine kinase [Pedobacter sp. SYP-B3415]|uniref:tetratricopeptide repeat-containing sensor histidine kinase n=1 Tax=Pedobacter sp. SYP-B3415 TaxID=2496641 RepID=UPI00101C7BC3|nr:sensor histidine kinase [Pedobacter sp. SYP-B3415]
MRMLLLLTAVLCSLSASAQTDTIRVLRQRYYGGKGELKRHALRGLLEQHRSQSPDSMLKYWQEFDRTISTHTAGAHAESAYYRAIYYLKANKLDSALQFTQTGLKKTGGLRKTHQAVCLQLLQGGILVRLNRKKEALRVFFSALQLAEQQKDQSNIIRALNGIGWVQMETEQYRKAIGWFRKAASSGSVGAGPALAIVYSNLASSYGALNRLDSSQYFIGLSLSLARKAQELSTLANAHAIHARIDLERKDEPAALRHMEQAVAARKLLQEPFYIVSDLCVLADIFAMAKKPDKGIATATEAMHLARKYKLEAKKAMIYASLGNNYRVAGNYKALARTLEARLALKDSLHSDALDEEFARMQARHEVSKKQQQISLLRSRETLQQLELDKRNTIIAITSGGLVLVVLMGYLLHNRNKLKQKSVLQAHIIRQQTMTTNKVLRAEENERKRIALELHDGLGQLFSVVKLNLSGIAQDISFKSPGSERTFAKAMDLVDESCREIRLIAHQMAPHILISSGLPAAVADLVNKIDSRQLKATIDVVGFDTGRLPANVESVLFRVIQEAVNNVIKHAGASLLDIQLIRESGQTTVMIEDNGKGFDVNSLELIEGMGLKNIRSRIEYLKGSVDFSSLDGRGTLIAIYLPV